MRLAYSVVQSHGPRPPRLATLVVLVGLKLNVLSATGYMRELTFQHTDGSFSAFGNRDKSGSMW